MSRLSAALGFLLVLLAACGHNIRSKEKVQEAIFDRLKANSGLNLSELDVSTTAVSFDKNMAYATVAFHEKGNSNLNSGMVMTYTLEDRGGKWAVVNVGDSHGRSLTARVPDDPHELPAGHPPVDSMRPDTAPNTDGDTRAR